MPRLPSSPNYLKAWPWVNCNRCGGTGIDEAKTKLYKEGKL